MNAGQITQPARLQDDTFLWGIRDFECVLFPASIFWLPKAGKAAYTPYVLEEIMSKYLSFCFLALLLCSCDSQTETQTDPEPAVEPSPEYADDMKLYTKTAQQLVADLSRQLKTELVSALSDGDAVNAIKVCAQQAPELTSAHANGGWSVRRISDRNRNPNNRADFTEAVVLAIFADATSDLFTETWTESDSGATYRYYKPIRTAPFCLKCHGDMQTLGPGVFGALKKLYPLDKATGYKAGELRGMFVVESNWPDGREYAEQLLTDSL